MELVVVWQGVIEETFTHRVVQISEDDYLVEYRRNGWVDPDMWDAEDNDILCASAYMTAMHEFRKSALAAKGNRDDADREYERASREPRQPVIHEEVVLAGSMPEEGLRAGQRGVVVHRYADGRALEVEFVVPKRTKVFTLRPDQVEAPWKATHIFTMVDGEEVSVQVEQRGDPVATEEDGTRWSTVMGPESLWWTCPIRYAVRIQAIRKL